MNVVINQMKVLHILFVVFILTACKAEIKSFPYISYADIYGKLDKGTPRNDELVVTLSGKDTLSFGRYAVTSNNERSILKTGYWKTFFPNGNIKDEGTYRVGSITDCCVGGLCMTYYHYKIGKWKYYNPEGDLQYELDYVPDSLHVDTRCEGGDKVIFGLIKNFDLLEYKYGITPDEIFQLQKVEIEDEQDFGKTIVIPISGKLLFRHEK